MQPLPLRRTDLGFGNICSAMYAIIRWYVYKHTVHVLKAFHLTPSYLILSFFIWDLPLPCQNCVVVTYHLSRLIGTKHASYPMDKKHTHVFHFCFFFQTSTTINLFNWIKVCISTWVVLAYLVYALYLCTLNRRRSEQPQSTAQAHTKGWKSG